jgi:hypothetical protein
MESLVCSNSLLEELRLSNQLKILLHGIVRIFNYHDLSLNLKLCLAIAVDI